MRYSALLVLVFLQFSTSDSDAISTDPYLVVLGNVQDAGAPQAACKKDCCRSLFENPDPARMVVSLGLVDPKSGQFWMFEATPDLPIQMKLLSERAGTKYETPQGIFLTHAHIGHYVGLMFLGKESMNANSVPVFAMPRMKSFLETNGPWNQLVKLKNIDIRELQNQTAISLTPELSITPFLVPHRDEYSETVGYKINGPNKSALFIPDIDKWGKWKSNIVEEISKVDYAYLDATFFDSNEVNRDISEIPHPFVIESMELFNDLSDLEKSKITFIHFNHTNPVLDPESQASKTVIENGFKLARLGDKADL